MLLNTCNKTPAPSAMRLQHVKDSLYAASASSLHAQRSAPFAPEILGQQQGLAGHAASETEHQWQCAIAMTGLRPIHASTDQLSLLFHAGPALCKKSLQQLPLKLCSCSASLRVIDVT